MHAVAGRARAQQLWGTEQSTWAETQVGTYRCTVPLPVERTPYKSVGNQGTGPRASPHALRLRFGQRTG